MNFTDIYNLEGWHEYISIRDKTKYEYGWDQKIRIYIPKFKQMAINEQANEKMKT